MTIDPVKLVLIGDLPCKKNRIRTGKGSRGHYAPGVKETLIDLQTQAAIQWRDRNGKLPPLEHPYVIEQMYIFNPAKDRDGIWTTILDVLKKAGVIIDDSIRHYNGPEHRHPAILVKSIRDERIEILIHPTESV